MDKKTLFIGILIGAVCSLSLVLVGCPQDLTGDITLVRQTEGNMRWVYVYQGAELIFKSVF